MPPAPSLLTVGHGTMAADELLELLRDAGIDQVVDVRRFPGSRRHPHVGSDQLSEWLPDAGIGYRWDERLGGRRRGRPDTPHTAIRNDSFRAYADHMDTEEWQVAMDELVAEAQQRRVAVMCSESVWWRCHRRFIADAAVVRHDLPAFHLMHDGRLTEHPITDGARVMGHDLVYDDHTHG